MSGPDSSIATPTLEDPVVLPSVSSSDEISSSSLSLNTLSTSATTSGSATITPSDAVSDVSSSTPSEPATVSSTALSSQIASSSAVPSSSSSSSFAAPVSSSDAASSSSSAPPGASSSSPTSAPASATRSSSPAAVSSPSSRPASNGSSSQVSQSSVASSRASSSGSVKGATARSSSLFPTETVIGAGATTGVFSTDSNADPPLVTGTSAGNGAAAGGKISSATLAAVLVPILLVFLVVLPLLVCFLRRRRRKRVRFMSTYEDLTGHDTSDGPRMLQAGQRGVSWAETVDSESQYDMCSIPSASSRLHLDIQARRTSGAPSQASSYSYADADDAPLVPGPGRKASSRSLRVDGAPSPSSVASRSKNWARALSPSFSTSRKGAFSPVPSDSHSRTTPSPRPPQHSRDDSMEEIDIALSPTSRSIMWEQADDPFANPNQKSFD